MRRGTLPELARHYAEAGPPKGEAVIVVEPPADESGPVDIDALLDDALGRMSVRDAAAAVSAATGWPRRDVYARALKRAAGSTPERDA